MKNLQSDVRDFCCCILVPCAVYGSHSPFADFLEHAKVGDPVDHGKLALIEVVPAPVPQQYVPRKGHSQGVWDFSDTACLGMGPIGTVRHTRSVLQDETIVPPHAVETADDRPRATEPVKLHFNRHTIGGVEDPLQRREATVSLERQV